MKRDAEAKRRSSPRAPRTPAEIPDFPSGFEIAGRHNAPGPEHICRDVEEFHSRFARGAGYEPVLRAIEWIAAARIGGFEWTPDGPRQHGDVPPRDEDSITVPWWVLSSLAGAIQLARRDRLSLDKILGIAGQGGGRTLWQRSDDTAQKAVRAVEVRHLIEVSGLHLEDAAGAVAERHGVTADLVKLNYREMFPISRPGSRKRTAERQ